MTNQENSDYVWRFAVEPKGAAPMYDDPLVEMVRVFLEDFLGMGFVTVGGRRATIDGFGFSNDPKKLYSIHRDHAATELE